MLLHHIHAFHDRSVGLAVYLQYPAFASFVISGNDNYHVAFPDM